MRTHEAIPATDQGTVLELRVLAKTFGGVRALKGVDLSVVSGEIHSQKLLEANSQFHLALGELSANSRLTTAYATISMQVQMCMAMNLRLRREQYGDPHETVRRHQILVDLIRSGELEGVLARLENPGDRSFIRNLDDLIGPVS